MTTGRLVGAVTGVRLGVPQVGDLVPQHGDLVTQRRRLLTHPDRFDAPSCRLATTLGESCRRVGSNPRVAAFSSGPCRVAPRSEALAATTASFWPVRLPTATPFFASTVTEVAANPDRA